MKTALLLFTILFIPFYSTQSQNSVEYYYNHGSDDCCECESCHSRQYKTMNRHDFDELKIFITNRWFDSTKLEFAKSAIDVNYFSTGQVKELLQLFSFESTKIELAKYAYQSTVDKGNYFKIYDLFSFESSIREIRDYIAKK